MCLVTKQKEPKTTKKDIVVYKIVDISYEEETSAVYSIYYGCRWIPGEIKEVDLLYENNKAWDVCEKYDILSSQSYNWKEIEEETFTEVSDGFHAAIKKNRLRASYRAEHRRFLIPAGSLIFTDKTGLIVSNKMMYYPYKKKTK